MMMSSECDKIKGDYFMSLSILISFCLLLLLIDLLHIANDGIVI